LTSDNCRKQRSHRYNITLATSLNLFCGSLTSIGDITLYIVSLGL